MSYRISVIIPTMNEEKRLSKLLEGIKNQTYRNYEVIVCDYKSADNTLSIAKSYKATVIHVKKKGISAGKNAGIYKASGDIIAFIDADYQIPKGLFESVVRQFNSNKNVVGVVPPQKANLKEISKEDSQKFKLFSSIYELLIHSKLLTKFPLGCVFCRADAVKKAGFFDEDITVAEDIDYYSRVSKYGKFILGKKDVKVSLRRFVNQGTMKTLLKYLDALITVKFGKKYKGKFERIGD